MIIMLSIVLIMLIGIAIWLLVKMYREALEDHVKYEMFYFPNFPSTFKEITLFFISDIHRREVSNKIINEVKNVAEFVIIGGDLMEKGVSFQVVEENLKKLKQIGPVYFVWGNNDYEVDTEKLKLVLKRANVNVLDNRSVTFNSDQGEKWHLVGIEDRSLELDDLELAMQDTGKDTFKILISHNPKVMEEVGDEDEIALVLSGHTHGGQIRIFGFGPYELGKTKIVGNTTILISNGYGTTSIPLRLGAKPETHLIKIKNSKEIH